MNGSRFANAGQTQDPPLRKSGFVGVIPCGRPRQNIEWNPINLENHLDLSVIRASRTKHASHDSVRRTTPLRMQP